MTTRLVAVGLALVLGGSTASAQLHLITGSPIPEETVGFPSGLFRISGTGAVEKVVDLMTSPGTDWIAASQDLRKAVLAPKNPWRQPVVVVDFDTPTAVKRCQEPYDTFIVARWLLDLPDRGPAYSEVLSPGGHVIEMRSMVLDRSVPCDQSFAKIDPSDARYLIASGQAGVADVGGYDWMGVLINDDGTITRLYPDGTAAVFPYRVPAGMFRDLAHRSCMLIANTRQLLAVSVIDYAAPATYRLLIFRKGDQTWHRVPYMGESTSYERAFGDYIAEVAAIRKGPGVTAESAGRAEWTKERTATGPGMSRRFAASYAVFPGHLYLYNAATGQTYTNNTHQGDSEILLVEDGVVYYRASDRLYRATIGADGLSAGTLLATSDVIRDAHWAFIKH